MKTIFTSFTRVFRPVNSKLLSMSTIVQSRSAIEPIEVRNRIRLKINKDQAEISWNFYCESDEQFKSCQKRQILNY